ncbi:MAG: hypothetical protein M3Q36_03585 [bacterium]|nr:hypothetical protein [bacterium]
MNKNLTRITVSAVIIAAILGITWLQAKDNSDQTANNDDQQSEQQEENKDEEKSETSEDKDEQSSDSVTYTAQSGDSFTEMARKAVQQYSQDNNSDLSEAAVVYAETVLTQNAGAPELNIGQSVEIKKSDLASVVDKAKNLSSAQVANWSKYVSNVNFDTSDVGGK